MSIMLDETYDISCQSQLSTVPRYVHKGEAKERFIVFSDLRRLFRPLHAFIFDLRCTVISKGLKVGQARAPK